MHFLATEPFLLSAGRTFNEKRLCTTPARGSPEKQTGSDRGVDPEDDANHDGIFALTGQDIDPTERYHVSKRKPPSQKRRRRRLPGQKCPPSPAREVQLDDVVDIIFNPVYGYGRLLLPTDTVVAHVLVLTRALA